MMEDLIYCIEIYNNDTEFCEFKMYIENCDLDFFRTLFKLPNDAMIQGARDITEQHVQLLSKVVPLVFDFDKYSYQFYELKK